MFVLGYNTELDFIPDLKAFGIGFFLAWVTVTLIPTFTGILLLKYVFKYKSPITLGTTVGALGSICKKAKSNASILGYTVPHAIEYAED